ncbi:TIR domain-containing protein [Zoogloea sp. LCSB751]|uniref:TIR domain-containing protein n=1 Tax=Zoogloea sp. LCSB751 TaxID=1965277 RepID=UPI0013747281|nr:TIR domain-containing protein [Zoogloea sp. LCSB751]
MSFERQVFISYAHLDNQPLTADQLGWVSLFHSTLQTLLSQRLGAPADIWRDDKLRGNDVFSDEILDQLARTALFVSVLTPRYLKSEWCTREITNFCQRAETEHRLVVGNKARVIKVLKLPIDGSGALPEAVGQLLGYEFYEFDEDRTPRELDPAYGDQPRQAFLRKANKLAWDLAAQLEQLQQQPAANDATDTSKPAVFLAECSRDRRDARECIEAELACCGYTVLPDRRLPDDEDDHRAAVAELLERCALSVHLIGAGYGRVPDGDSSESVVVLQNRLAAERSRQAGLRRVIWLPADTTATQPAQQTFIDALQQDAALQLGADLVNGDLEALKAAIHAALKKPEAAPDTPDESGTAGALRVHLLCDARDRKDSVPLIKLLRGRGLDVTLPLFAGDAAEVREANRQRVLDCDALILYYGAGDETWKYHQENELRKLQGQDRQRPLRARFTLLAPPLSDDKEVLQALADADTLDGLGGLDPQTLAPLATALGLEPAP